MTRETSSAVSASRPKNSSRSSAVYGRGPTYGASSSSTTVTPVHSATPQFAGKVHSGSPVNAQLQRAEVAVQVVARGGFGGHLDRHAHPPQACLRRRDEPPMDDAEVPVGEPVADEQQRRAGQPTLDLMREERRITGDGYEEVEIVVLGQDERFGDAEPAV